MIIRKARIEDAAGIANVQISSWRTTYPGIVPDTYLKNMDPGERKARWHRVLSENKTTTVIAEDGNGRIVGFANGGTERTQRYGYDGELYAFYILKEYQRQGIGKKLIKQFTEELQAEDFEKILVWVLKENPSRRFYESLDPKNIGKQMITIGGLDLIEVAYGWPNIVELYNKLQNRRWKYPPLF